MQASFEPTELGKLTGEIASAFRSIIESAGLTFRAETSEMPRPIYVDRPSWEKIVFNLLSNAFKFTHRGSITVSVKPSPDGRHAVLQVSDTGIGIASDELPRLFERFHRIEGAQGRSFEGTGIGLALVQELVRLHGGKVRAESQLGAGTSNSRRSAARRPRPTADAHRAHNHAVRHRLAGPGSSEKSGPLCGAA